MGSPPLGPVGPALPPGPSDFGFGLYWAVRCVVEAADPSGVSGQSGGMHIGEATNPVPSPPVSPQPPPSSSSSGRQAPKADMTAIRQPVRRSKRSRLVDFIGYSLAGGFADEPTRPRLRDA